MAVVVVAAMAAGGRISAAEERISAAGERVSAAEERVSVVRRFAASAALASGRHAVVSLTSVVRMFAALTSVARRFAAPTSVARRFAAHTSVARRFAALTSVARRFAAHTSVAPARWSVALARWAVGPLGTSGVITIITGGPVGTAVGVVGADGADGPTGPTSTATFWPSRSGLTAITIRSGLMEIFSSGMPCSGPVLITPMAQGTLTYMETMHMAALHERAPLEPANLTAKSQARQPHPPAVIWRRPAAGWRRA